MKILIPAVNAFGTGPALVLPLQFTINRKIWRFVRTTLRVFRYANTIDVCF